MVDHVVVPSLYVYLFNSSACLFTTHTCKHSKLYLWLSVCVCVCVWYVCVLVYTQGYIKICIYLCVQVAYIQSIFRICT